MSPLENFPGHRLAAHAAIKQPVAEVVKVHLKKAGIQSLSGKHSSIITAKCHRGDKMRSS